MFSIPSSFSTFSQPCLGHHRGLVLLVDHEVAGIDLLGRLGARQFFALHQLRDDDVDARVLVGRFLAGAADDQRRTRFVDQDRIHFVHDAEVVSALHAVLHIELHVVAQIVEAEFVVGAVGDVAGVGGLALLVVQIVDDHAHRQSQEAVQLSHPLRVALGQVIIHRHHVHAAPGQRIQIHRQGRHQRLAFAGLHLGDASGVQHHAADQLHVEVAHVQHAPSCLAHHCECLFQNRVQHFFDGAVLALSPTACGAPHPSLLPSAPAVAPAAPAPGAGTRRSWRAVLRPSAC